MNIIYNLYIFTNILLIQQRIFQGYMSSRKSSLKVDRVQDIFDFNGKSIELNRIRKNSVGIAKPTLQQIQTNININFDTKLTQKLMFIKKLQKMQKDAIKLYYEQKPTECFQLLQKTLNLLQQKSIHNSNQGISEHPQHFIYIRYLQCQFKYKLKLYEQSRQFYQRVMKIIPKLSKSERQKTKQYLTSLDILNCCLLYQQGKFTDSIKSIQQFQTKIQQSKYKINQKLLKQLAMCKIQSLLQINDYKSALSSIEQFINTYDNLSLREKWKIYSMFALSYKRIGDGEKAQQIMQQLIANMRKQESICDSLSKYNNNGQKYSDYKAYLSKSYASYVEMFWDQPIKATFLAKKWEQECPSSDHAKIKLFHLYFKIGDYQEALIEYSQLSQNYKKGADDWQTLGQIKYFYGQNQTAKHLYCKALQLTKNQEKRMILQIKLLEFCEENAKKQSLKNVEKRIKQNRLKVWINKIIEKYGQYLQSIGEDSRLQKIQRLFIINNSNQAKNNLTTNSIHQLLQTGKFGSVTLNKQQKQSTGNIRKRNSLAVSKLI